MNLLQIWEAIGNIYLQALVILSFSVALALLVNLLFKRVLLRITTKVQTELGARIVRLLRRPIFYSIVLIGLYNAVAYLGIPKQADFYFAGAVKSVALVIWSIAALRMASVLIETLSRRPDPIFQKRFAPLLDNLAKITIVVTGLMVLLSIWGVQVTALLASAGVIGIVLGFAARDTLSNLFSGLSLLIDSPYKVGDLITLDSGERGIVTDIGIRSTRILTRDDVEITIPNSQIAASKITNESGPRPKTRIRIPIGVAYGSDVDKVKQLLRTVAQESEYVCAEPLAQARLVEFGESSLNFQLLCWIEDPVFQGRAIDQLNTQIYKKFQEQGIEIPFPKRDLYIKQWPNDLRPPVKE